MCAGCWESWTADNSMDGRLFYRFVTPGSRERGWKWWLPNGHLLPHRHLLLVEYGLLRFSSLKPNTKSKTTRVEIGPYMIIKPKVRGFICTNSHPVGCAANVQEQIDYTRQQGELSKGPKNVLVLGCSTGYGLSSRITAAFGSGAATLGVCFEKPPTERKTASAGY